MGLAKDAVEITLMLAMPMLLLGMVVGLGISIFQSVTQIQEMTLAFVPKIVAVLLGLFWFGPWMLSKMISYTEGIITNLPQYIR